MPRSKARFLQTENGKAGTSGRPPAPVSHQKQPHRNATNAVKLKRKHSKINEADRYSAAHNGLVPGSSPGRPTTTKSTTCANFVEAIRQPGNCNGLLAGFELSTIRDARRKRSDDAALAREKQTSGSANVVSARFLQLYCSCVCAQRARLALTTR